MRTIAPRRRAATNALAAALAAALALLLATASTALASSSSSAATAGAGGEGGGGSCAAGDASSRAATTSRSSSPSSPRKRRRRRARDPSESLTALFRNDSPHRADVHHDDGMFGSVVGTAEAYGGILRVHTFPGHRFFVTLHGAREGLVDPETDEQHFYEVGAEGEDDDDEPLFLVPEDASPSATRCRDRYPVCASEARRGECARNPGWMIVNCCRSCDEEEGYGHLVDREVRCDPERLNATVPAWREGSLDELFSRWATAEEYKVYEPRVVSSPYETERYDSRMGGGPWIMTFDAFLSEYEVSQLLEGARLEGFMRSTDQGASVGNSGERAKVTSKTRTSSNAWCRSRCEGLEGVRSVTRKIEDLTGIRRNNYESFQILKYEEGQFYRRHHDSSGRRNGSPSGPRILTFFLYLNDVEEGGATRFTDLDLAVAPKKGRALVWPSVRNEDPEKSDLRMYHEAMEVTKGTKYAANHWIHQYDFVSSNLWGCGSMN